MSSRRSNFNAANLINPGVLLQLDNNVGIQSVTVDATSMTAGIISVYAGNTAGTLLFTVNPSSTKTLSLGQADQTLFVTASSDALGSAYIQWTDQQLSSAAYGGNSPSGVKVINLTVPNGGGFTLTPSQFGLQVINAVQVVNDGTHTVQILATDGSGNALSNTYNVAAGQIQSFACPGAMALIVANTSGSDSANFMVAASSFTQPYFDQNIGGLPYIGQVGINGSIDPLGGRTAINISVDEKTATTTIYTVPAATTLYICSAWIAYIGAAVAGNRVIMHAGGSLRSLLQLAATPSFGSVSMPIPVSVATGTNVVLDGTGGAMNATSAGFSGYTIP